MRALPWCLSRGLVLACACLFFAAESRAELPGGAYSLALEGSAGLAFPSGDAEVCTPVDAGEACVSSSVSTDPSGAVTGTGALAGDDGEVSISLSFALTGSVGGSIGKPKARFDFTLEGVFEESGGGTQIEVTGEGKMACKLDRDFPNQLFCRARTRLCGSLGGETICDRLSIPVPVAFERVPFRVDLDLVTGEKNVVTGDGEVVIDAATAATYTAKGKYKPTADTTNLKLESVDTALKTKVALKKVLLEAGGATSGVVAFKVAGQTGKATLPTAP